jgi:hypothetical protein
VPLLITVSGALVLVVAVVLARLGGRLRHEIGDHPRRPPGRPTGVVPSH